MRVSSNVIDLKLSEIGAALCVGTAALIVVNGYLVDLLGYPIEPTSLAILTGVEWVVVGSLWRLRCQTRVQAEARSLVAYVLIVLGMFGYIAWLSYPSFLPVSFPYDLTHHVSLIDYIAQNHSLPHDPELQPYLEVDYTLGSHILGALGARIFSVDGFRIVHLVTAFIIGLKAGVIFILVSRLLPVRSTVVSFAGPLISLLPYGYSLGSFLNYGYYAQIVAELFTMAMLASIFMWWARPSRVFLVFFAICGIASFLTWPLWLPVPVSLSLVLVLGYRTLTIRERINEAVYAVAPIGVVALLYILPRVRYASVLLTFGGGVLKPWPEVYGLPFLVMSLVGITVSLRKSSLLPLAAFAVLTIFEATALLLLDVWIRETTFYLTFKMFYLLCDVQVLFAAFLLGDFWRVLQSAFIRISRATVVVPGMVIALVLQHGLPLEPSLLDREALYSVANWAKTHVPVACTSVYPAGDSGVAYWVYVSVFGLPRDSVRVTASLVSRPETALVATRYWSDPDGLPYAILVEHSLDITRGNDDVQVLYRVGDVEVVHRTDVPVCTEKYITLDDFRPAVRTGTFAQWLATVGFR